MTTKQNKFAGSLLKGLYLLLSGAGVGWLIGLSVSEVIYAVITSIVALIVSVTGALAGINIEREERTDSTDAKPKRRVRVEVDPLPITFMIIGLVVGSSFGIYGRTNGWLGPRPANFIERWKVTGRSEKELSGQLLDEIYPPNAEAADPRGGGPKESREPSGAAGESSGEATQEGAAGGDAEGAESNGEGAGGGKGGRTGGNAEAPPAPKRAASADAGAGDITRKALTPALFSATGDECASFRAAPDDELQNLLTHLSGSSDEAEAVRSRAKACANIKCLRDIVKRICSKSRRN